MLTVPCDIDRMLGLHVRMLPGKEQCLTFIYLNLIYSILNEYFFEYKVHYLVTYVIIREKNVWTLSRIFWFAYLNRYQFGVTGTCGCRSTMAQLSNIIIRLILMTTKLQPQIFSFPRPPHLLNQLVTFQNI